MQKPSDCSEAGWEFALRRWWLWAYSTDFPGVRHAASKIDAAPLAVDAADDWDEVVADARAFDSATEELRERLKDNIDHQTQYGATISVNLDLEVLARFTPGGPDAD